MNRLGVRVIITLGALLVIGARLIWPDVKVDTLIVAMLLVAVLPWLAGVIKSAELPGGWKIEFQDIKAAGEKVTGIATTAIATPTAEMSGDAVLESTDPNLALVGLRIEIEKRLRALAELRGISPSGRSSLHRLIEQLRFSGALHSSEASGLNDLVSAGNQAAHGANVAPGIAMWAGRYGPDILRILDSKLKM
jgi:hypothetical protein